MPALGQVRKEVHGFRVLYRAGTCSHSDLIASWKGAPVITRNGPNRFVILAVYLALFVAVPVLAAYR